MDDALPTPDRFSQAVVMYVTTYCGYCRMAKQLLETRNIPYEAVDVTENTAMRNWLVETTNQRTVPQIFIQGVSIGGYSELSALDRKGELQAAIARENPEAKA